MSIFFRASLVDLLVFGLMRLHDCCKPSSDSSAIVRLLAAGPSGTLSLRSSSLSAGSERISLETWFYSWIAVAKSTVALMNSCNLGSPGPSRLRIII